jgi:hypothetical protein
MNAPSANTEEASNIALACENFIRKMGFKNYEYQCDSPKLDYMPLWRLLNEPRNTF